jgi:iron complex transport system substrate-binding protein
MTKVCSFLPAVTQMIYDMGLQQQLIGVTFECPELARKEKWKVLNSVFENNTFTSIEIDQLFSSYKNDGKPIYSIDEELFLKTQSDVVFTQDICDVCIIDTSSVEQVIQKYHLHTEIVSMSPNTLEEVFDHALLIGKKMQAEVSALQYLSKQRSRIDQVQQSLLTAPIKTLALLEWFDPFYNCGHWIPDQIKLAKGVDYLSNPHGDSYRISFENLITNNPEYIILAPCGYTIERTLQELHLLTQQSAWNELQAVKNNRVYIVPYEHFTQSSLSTLVTGIEILASILHPDVYPLSDILRDKVYSLNTLNK